MVFLMFCFKQKLWLQETFTASLDTKWPDPIIAQAAVVILTFGEHEVETPLPESLFPTRRHLHPDLVKVALRVNQLRRSRPAAERGRWGREGRAASPRLALSLD